MCLQAVQLMSIYSEADADLFVTKRVLLPCGPAGPVHGLEIKLDGVTVSVDARSSAPRWSVEDGHWEVVAHTQSLPPGGTTKMEDLKKWHKTHGWTWQEDVRLPLTNSTPPE